MNTIMNTDLILRILSIAMLSSFAWATAAVAEAVSIRCDFDRFSDHEGVHAETFGFEIRFDSITRDAYIQGNAGLMRRFSAARHLCVLD